MPTRVPVLPTRPAAASSQTRLLLRTRTCAGTRRPLLPGGQGLVAKSLRSVVMRMATRKRTMSRVMKASGSMSCPKPMLLVGIAWPSPGLMVMAVVEARGRGEAEEDDGGERLA